MIMKWLAPPCLVFAVGCAQAEPMTVIELEKRLTAELPMGTPVEEVAAYINANGFSSDGVVGVDDVRPIKNRPGFSDLLAMLRGVRKSGIVSTALQMQFIFDEAGKLVELSVREIHTGP